MSCQIAFVFGDQVAACVIGKDDLPTPFKSLQMKAAEGINLDAGASWEDVFFVYEDDDGDSVTISSDLDLAEAINLNEDKGLELLRQVVLRKRQLPMAGELDAGAQGTVPVGTKNDDDSGSDVEEKSYPVSNAVQVFDEQFVLEFVKFLSDPAFSQIVPEMCSVINAAVMRRATAEELGNHLVSSFPILKDTVLFKTQWDFLPSWAKAYDAFIDPLTEDQLGKLCFQIPIVASRLVAKKGKLHHYLFIKKRPLSKIIRVKQFDFGDMDLAAIYSNVAAASTGAGGISQDHLGSLCVGCGASPIHGVRFRCMVCPNLDLCSKCEASGVHRSDHALMKFNTPAAGFLGLSNGSVLLGKKVQKHHLKALKFEAKLAKKSQKIEARIARKAEKALRKSSEKTDEKLLRKAHKHHHHHHTEKDHKHHHDHHAEKDHKRHYSGSRVFPEMRSSGYIPVKTDDANSGGVPSGSIFPDYANLN